MCNWWGMFWLWMKFACLSNGEELKVDRLCLNHEAVFIIGSGSGGDSKKNTKNLLNTNTAVPTLSVIMQILLELCLGICTRMIDGIVFSFWSNLMTFKMFSVKIAGKHRERLHDKRRPKAAQLAMRALSSRLNHKWPRLTHNNCRSRFVVNEKFPWQFLSNFPQLIQDGERKIGEVH